MNLENTGPKLESFGKNPEITSTRLSGEAQGEMKDWLQKQSGAPQEWQKSSEKSLPSLTIDTSATPKYNNGNGDRPTPAITPSGSDINHGTSPSCGDNQVQTPSTDPRSIDASNPGATGGNYFAENNGQNTAGGTNPGDVTPVSVGGTTLPESNSPGPENNASTTEVNPPAVAGVSGAVGVGVDSNSIRYDSRLPQFEPAPAAPLDQPINASGVQQAQNGDGYFLAALASVANTPNGPAEIGHMITNNADGSHTVVFPGAANVSINVTDTEIKNNALQNSAQWANIIEAAFLKYQHGDSLQAMVPREDGINPFGNARQEPMRFTCLQARKPLVKQILS